ncbi:MAG: hypothetical protein SFY67_09410 [Candidatus Melainabacteria bacterium]|nr:hypothetical protein [Candidatus Melainabacteria bacterium]
MSNKNKAAPSGDEKELKDKEAAKPDIQPEPKPVPENGTSAKEDKSEDKEVLEENEESSKEDEDDDDSKKEEACCK